MRGDGNDEPANLRMRVLGPLEVELDGERIELRRLEARLLLTLAWSPNTWVDHDTLSERVYFDGEARDTTSWRNHLRRTLGSASAAVETRRGRGSRLVTGPEHSGVSVDVNDFQTFHREGDEALRSGEYGAALSAFRQATDLWRGSTPFAEIADDVERHAGIVALQAQRRQCRQAAVRLAIDAGEFAAALPDLRTMIDEDPTDQATIAHLMRASAALGNPTMASDYYDRLCRLLGDRGELPLAEVINLHGQILREELQPRSPPSDQFGVDLTTFVGRVDDVERANEALGTSRLVTLVGPPGVGKSRMARELAREHSQRNAVWLIQLASCPDGSEVAVRRHIAHELELERRSDRGFAEDLAKRLGGQPTILVLDNCEHVIETLIVVLAGLFSHGQGVRILATSREPLGIPGEVVLRLHALSFDSRNSRNGSAPATAMCLDRVVAAGGDVANEVDLTDICRELDGLPLAIELVAPAIAVGGIDATLERLRSGASPIPSAHGTDTRHRSLNSAVNWSFERLDESERDTLLAAATFRTDVDADDVAAVTGYDPVQTADWLLSLTAQSLLRAGIEAGRFSPFEVVRRFARLAARRTGRAASFEAAHAKWISDLVSDDVPSRRVLAEATQALQWAIEAPPADGITIVDSLRHDLYRIELPPGLADWLYGLQQRDDRLGLIATELWANCAFFQGSYADLERLARHTLHRVERIGEPHRLPRVYVMTAFSFASSGEYGAAAEHAAKAESLAHAASDTWAYAWAASIDAYQHRRQRHFDEARVRAHEALARFEGMDYPQGKAFPLYTLAIADYREHGDVGGAARLLNVGIEHAVAGADAMMEATGQLFRAQLFAEQGDVATAAAGLIRTFECLSRSPHWNLIASALEYSAVLLASHGDEETATRLTSVSAQARWKNQLKTQSRAIPYLPPRAVEPLLALPDRPDPRFMTTDPVPVTMQNAIAALHMLIS